MLFAPNEVRIALRQRNTRLIFRERFQIVLTEQYAAQPRKNLLGDDLLQQKDVV